MFSIQIKWTCVVPSAANKTGIQLSMSATVYFEYVFACAGGVIRRSNVGVGVFSFLPCMKGKKSI